MTDPRRTTPEPWRLLAWALIVIALTAGAGLTIALADAGGLLFYGTYAGTGAYLAFRRPLNSVGWLLMAAGWGLAFGTVQYDGSLEALLTSSLEPVEALSAWSNGWGWALTNIAFFGVILVFPNGHLPTGRARWLSVAGLTALIGLAVLLAFGPEINVTVWQVGRSVDVPNPVAVFPDATFWTAVPDPSVLFALMFAFVVAGLVVLTVRAHRSTGIERLQSRWFVAATASVALGSLLWAIGMVILPPDSPLPWIGVLVTYPTIPIAIAIAVLRYRLFEIDRIISRTIAYGGVTIVLFAIFAGVNLTLQAVLDPVIGGGSVAVAASTLAVAALFNPLRGRLQRVVDRRFNRTGRGAELTVDRFAGRLRDQLDLETLGDELMGAAVSAVEPAAATFWLRPRKAAR